MYRLIKTQLPFSFYYILESEKPCPHCGETSPIIRILGQDPPFYKDDLVFMPYAELLTHMAMELTEFIKDRYPFWCAATSEAYGGRYLGNHCRYCWEPFAEDAIYDDLADLEGTPFYKLFMGREAPDADEPFVIDECPPSLLDPYVAEEVTL